MDSGKKPKAWNPRDQAQVPVRKCPFPTKSLDNKPKSKIDRDIAEDEKQIEQACLLYTSPSPRDRQKSRMPSSA